MHEDLPNISADSLSIPTQEQLQPAQQSAHTPRILLLYGSTRQRSFSRLVVQEAARLLETFGAETRIFNPSGLPLPDDVEDTHPKVVELRELMQWSEGQVCGGSQSFNVVNQLRALGRWMRMFTIPNQSSVPKAFTEFADNDRMQPSPYYDRIVDVMEELVKFTLLLRDRQDYLVDRYSERKESAQELSQRVNQGSI